MKAASTCIRQACPHGCHPREGGRGRAAIYVSELGEGAAISAGTMICTSLAQNARIGHKALITLIISPQKFANRPHAPCWLAQDVPRTRHPLRVVPPLTHSHASPNRLGRSTVPRRPSLKTTAPIAPHHNGARFKLRASAVLARLLLRKKWAAARRRTLPG